MKVETLQGDIAKEYCEVTMAQITINVPDELAQRLEPLQGQLPELVTQFVEWAIFPPSYRGLFFHLR